MTIADPTAQQTTLPRTPRPLTGPILFLRRLRDAAVRVYARGQLGPVDPASYVGRQLPPSGHDHIMPRFF